MVGFPARGSDAMGSESIGLIRGVTIASALSVGILALESCATMEDAEQQVRTVAALT
jgi:hypothetical protein